MPRKLSENQEASLDALKAACQAVDFASVRVWRNHCPKGVSVHPEAMVKTGKVKRITAAYSTNGTVTDLYAPADEG